MKAFKKLLMVGLLASTALYAGQALADATETGVGATSTSTDPIVVTVPPVYNIAGDLAYDVLATYTSTGFDTITQSNNEYVATNDIAQVYSLTATMVSIDPGTPATEFVLTSADGSSTLGFTPYWNDIADGIDTATALTYGVGANFGNASNTLIRKIGDEVNATFGFKILSGILNVTPAGSYSGTINLLVGPTV